MAKETVHIVQSYVRGRGRGLKAEQQVGCKTAEEARRKADTELGDYDEDPVILFRSGELPHPFTET
jgi:hypothetical protein